MKLTLYSLISLLSLLIREYLSISNHPDEAHPQLLSHQQHHSMTQHVVNPSLHQDSDYIGSHGGAWSPCTHVRHSLNFDCGLALYLHDEFRPRSVLEFGSGLGLYVDFFYRKYNVSRAIGIEPIIMKLPHHISVYKSFDNFTEYPSQSTFSIEKYNNETRANYDSQLGTFDLVYSIEVAEHIDYKYHYALADFLSSRTNRYLMFSAAHLGQTGLGHIGLRPVEGWIHIFQQYGMKYLPHHTKTLRMTVDHTNINHHTNSLVFSKFKNESDASSYPPEHYNKLKLQKDKYMNDLWGGLKSHLEEINRDCTVLEHHNK